MQRAWQAYLEAYEAWSAECDHIHDDWLARFDERGWGRDGTVLRRLYDLQQRKWADWERASGDLLHGA
jgi:hypothetical protein